ncbi:MAG: 50S ribosomal protein L5 [Candidatus Peribacteraceae bacterium]|jgi:large subunit ribosomal protein L5|nr:50S ribosomal protein L5 [Candidatus Peribacteraceae bacterium]MDP7454116.1 50S ribosomal protein L5 [Candidatus Peribacteraceae bacterium]MDP7645988.1 50S ribosomal protein L5 [Candidatus Peribacteraceae bacterium]|tara:strand:- start:638 stop:1351 length:714 start_codon:yes stop_codon:yes gene_type:complete
MAYASLHDRLRGPIAKDLKKDLGIKNTYALPRIEKVVVNVGINKSKMDSKEMHQYVIDSLAQITGQKPVVTKARVAISNFKTREGMVVGAMVTLRGKQMEEFLDRLISYSLPRIRDFRGVTTNFDGHGNYAIGIQDHSIFPEVPLPDAKQIFGLQVQITTTTDSDKEAKVLLKAIGMPFKKEAKETNEEKEKKEKAEALQVAKEEAEEGQKEEEGQEEKEANSEPEPEPENSPPEST